MKKWGGLWDRGPDKHGAGAKKEWVRGRAVSAGNGRGAVSVRLEAKKNNNCGAGRGRAFGAAVLQAMRSTVAWGAALQSVARFWGEGQQCGNKGGSN